MNKTCLNQALNNYFFIIIIYLLYALFISSLPKADILLGADWSFPVTNSQIKEKIDTLSYTWYGVNFGTRNIGLTHLPLIYVEKFFILVSNQVHMKRIVLLFLNLKK